MSATYVELVDGRIVTRDAEAWRAECLARHVLNLPTLDERRSWLADFERRHGKEDADRLRETMKLIHGREKP